MMRSKNGTVQRKQVAVMRFRDFHPNVRFRIAMNFFNNTLGNMVTPFMAVYLAKTLGTTIAGTAAIVGIAVGLACATLGGHYADRYGRKRMMLLAESLGTLAYAVMALANSPWLYSASVTLLMTVLVSASWGFGKPAFEAMLIDVSTPDTRKAIYRISYWSNNLAISIAGMIGAYFFSAYLFELLLAVGALSLLSALATAFLITETMPVSVREGARAGAAVTGGAIAGGAASGDIAGDIADTAAGDIAAAAAVATTGTAAAANRGSDGRAGGPQGSRVSLLRRYAEVLRDRTFVTYVIAGVLTVSAEMNLTGYIGIRLARDMHQAAWFPGVKLTTDGLSMLGFLRTENTLVVVLLSLFVGRLLKNKSDTRTMLAAMALNVAGYACIAYGSQPALLVLVMLLATVGELVYVPLKQALLAGLVPDHARSSYMAVNGMTNRAAQMLSGLNVVIGGFLPSGAMAVLLLVTGFAGIALLASVAAGSAGSRAARAKLPESSTPQRG
jgi:DHA1 family multidrug resistance protein B-like MFS transporter